MYMYLLRLNLSLIFNNKGKYQISLNRWVCQMPSLHHDERTFLILHLITSLHLTKLFVK